MESEEYPQRRAAYSIIETAELLGVSRGHIYNMAKRNEIRLVKLGKRVLIPASEISRLLAAPKAE